MNTRQIIDSTYKKGMKVVENTIEIAGGARDIDVKRSKETSLYVVLAPRIVKNLEIIMGSDASTCIKCINDSIKHYKENQNFEVIIEEMKKNRTEGVSYSVKAMKELKDSISTLAGEENGVGLFNGLMAEYIQNNIIPGLNFDINSINNFLQICFNEKGREALEKEKEFILKNIETWKKDLKKLKEINNAC